MRSIVGIGLFLVALFLVPLFLSACGGSKDPMDALDDASPLRGANPTTSEIQIPILTDDRAKMMLTSSCSGCHTKTPIKKAKKSKLEWEAQVQFCKDRGALIAPMDAKSLANWLSHKYGN